jgi:iron complex outermembrane receptor protein
MITLNLAAFRETATDYQANTVDPVLLRTYIANVPEVRSQGVEIDAQARPLDGLTLYGSVAYTDAVYSSFPSAPCGLEAITSPSCNLSGRRAAGVPLWSASAGGEYAHPFSIGGLETELFGALDYSYRSAFDSVGNSRYTIVDEVGLLNSRFGVRSPGGDWSAHLWARNLLDEEYLTTKTPLFNNGGIYSNLGDPRMVGATLSLRQ